MKRFLTPRVYAFAFMKTWLDWFIATLLVTAAGAGSLSAREETIPISETRRIVINVPDGFTYSSGINTAGAPGFTLSDTKEKVSLQVTFEPDVDDQFNEARARRELMHERFREFVDSSVEKGMQFEELETKVGAATYCVFTDAKLAGKKELPPNEYLHVTTGVKSWPGIVATFMFFSNDTASPQHQAILKVLRESVHENPAPLL